jgi:hypothetical protein
MENWVITCHQRKGTNKAKLKISDILLHQAGLEPMYCFTGTSGIPLLINLILPLSLQKNLALIFGWLKIYTCEMTGLTQLFNWCWIAAWASE